MHDTLPVTLCHNLDPGAFKWLWMKYVHGFNERHHCTNSLRGWYGRKLNKANPDLLRTPEIVLDERRPTEYSAIYICGVSKRGYPKRNYPHNLHAVVIPSPGASDTLVFDAWHLTVRDGRFLPIPEEGALPERFRALPQPYTSCRIVRWAACFFEG
jgi:hypothetical protein